MEIPLLGYPQRRPDQRLHPVGRREPPAVCKHSAFRLKAFKLKLVHDLCDRQPDHREFRSRRQPAATDNLTIEQVITDNVVDGACSSEVGRQGAHLPHVLPFVAEDVAWMPCRVQLRLRHLQGVSLPTRHLFPGLSSAPLND